jgi:hypothetical protein
VLAVGAKHWQDGSEFITFTAVGNGNDQVGVFDHAKVAVAGFGRMHKHCGSARGRQGRSDLATHMAAFAHAHHDHAACDFEDCTNGLHE